MTRRSPATAHITLETAGPIAENVGSRQPLARGAGAPATGFGDRYAAARQLQFDATGDKLNHNVFRYPAKFHPPIARKLIELVSKEADTVLDPFCGSGTLLVEAAGLGRNAIGTDVDPLAIFVSQAKTSIINAVAITNAADRCTEWLRGAGRVDEDRWGAFTSDIDEAEFAASRTEIAVWVPDLPNMAHWFRRRAIIQLATIRRHIAETYDGDAKLFIELCFASIIRNSSNADPVPVSGLEVTSHMLAKEAKGRTVNPWQLMARTIVKSLPAMKAFISARKEGVTSSVHLADARNLDENIAGGVAAIITSPPYLTAVDYYRRHTLEMYWLGLTSQRAERLALMGRYIGRDRVGQVHFPAESTNETAKAVADRWIPRFPGIKDTRERAFRHYCNGMSRSLARMREVVTPGGPIVIVAGDVRFCGAQVSMLELMNDLAGEHLKIRDHLWYPIMNRYMSYSRRNEASIAADHILVFRSAE